MARKTSPRSILTEMPAISREAAGFMLARLVEPVVIHAIGPEFDRSLLIPQWMPANTKRPSAMGRAMAQWLVGKQCLVCGGRTKLQAHHILAWHLWPQWGMESRLWAPLCRGNPEIDCHAVCGHAGNMKGICLHVLEFSGLLNKARAMNAELIQILERVAA